MGKQEFFLLIPGIINGVAIVDLLKIFKHKKNYIEMIGWGIITMLAIISNWILLYEDLEIITDSKVNYYMVVIQAILIVNLASVLTPEERDVDTKKYFLEVRKSFFWLYAVITAYAILLERFVFSMQTPIWLQLTAIVLFLICAYSDRYWLRLTLLGVALLLVMLDIFPEMLY